MAEIKSGASSDKLTVDPTSKAARTSPYDTRGNYYGPKATYGASLTAKTAVATGTGTIVAVYGSATKTIRVQRVLISVTVGAAAVYGDMICYKRTASISGGTKTDLTQTPFDSTSAAGTLNICGVYTVDPTEGTGGGPIASSMQYCPISGTPALGPAQYDFDWRNGGECECPVLRGTAQGLEFNFGTTTTNAPTLTVTVWWTEE